MLLGHFLNSLIYLLVFNHTFQSIPISACNLLSQRTAFVGDQVKVGWAHGRAQIAAGCPVWKAAYFFSTANFRIMIEVFSFEVRGNGGTQIFAVQGGAVSSQGCLFSGAAWTSAVCLLYRSERSERWSAQSPFSSQSRAVGALHCQLILSNAAGHIAQPVCCVYSKREMPLGMEDLCTTRPRFYVLSK